MWTHHFEEHVQLPVAPLWKVLANVAGWVDIDHNIEKLVINQPPALGTPFVLKPKGAPSLKFIIETFQAPTHYADLCSMPGAKMRTLHTLVRLNEHETKIMVDIEIKGPLAWFWGATVGKNHAAGLSAQTNRFVAAAKKPTA